MSATEPTKQEITNMINYIKETIRDVSHQDLKVILRIIMNSGISDDTIQTKGGGTQIKFKDMHYKTIVSIHAFLVEKITGKMDKLKSLTVEQIQ